jgi:galactonate dehydratase
MRITAVTPMLMRAGSPRVTGWSSSDTAGGLSSAGSRHWCFVRIETDAGIVGIGEGSGWPRMVAAGITDLGARILGENPLEIERLWQTMFTAQMGHGQTGTPGAGAMAAIDMALWDIAAKALDVPLWRLLGGRVRDRVRTYVHVATADQACEAVARGFGMVKVGHVAQALGKAFAVRDALGPAIDIAIDLHGPPWLTAADATSLCQELESVRPLFIEEPVAPEDIEGFRRVRASCATPLAAGERLANLWAFRPMLEQGLIDVAQPDPGRVGISQMRKIAAMAEAGFVTIAPHAGTLGPVAELAAIHLLAAIPNALVHERFLDDWEGREQVLSHPLVIAEGHALVPERPGLGAELTEQFVDAHPPGVNVAQPTAQFTSGYAPGTADEGLYSQRRPARAQFLAQHRPEEKQ